MQTIDRDEGLRQRRDQKQPATPVIKEQVFGVPARHGGLYLCPIRHREYRRMGAGAEGDILPRQIILEPRPIHFQALMAQAMG